MDCPAWRKSMSKVCHKCPLWKQVRGKHPQTGADVDAWDCAVSFLPMLLIENAMVARSTTATLDKFREETRQTNDTGMAATLMRMNAQMMAATQESIAAPHTLRLTADDD